MKDRITTIAVVGGGPAGSAVSIRLAAAGFAVTLIERERFPREKLCGEFISPECLDHFRTLGVYDQILDSGGARIAETRFFAMNGRNAAVPSRWLGSGLGNALSLSRAEMDDRLATRARDAGVDVIEGAPVTGVEVENENIRSLTLRSKGESTTIAADIVIDASGRSGILRKLYSRSAEVHKPETQRPDLIAFKVHVEGADLKHDRCEIYSFPDGYGGLSPIGGGLANHCFMVRAPRARQLDGCTDRIVAELVSQNPRAREALAGAVPVSRWLSVAISGYGRRGTRIAKNAFAVGDSAAFIDPFTGSGMLMALESAETLADCIRESDGETARIAAAYNSRHTARFARRMRICGLLRYAAFRPAVGSAAVAFLGASTGFRRLIARSTRQGDARNAN